MSEPTPQELEQLRAKLADAGRAERPDATRAAAGLDALLEGEVAPGPWEGPPVPRSSRGARLGFVVVVLGVIAALWWWLREGTLVEVKTPVVGVASVDAGTLVPEPVIVPEPVVDAGSPELGLSGPPSTPLGMNGAVEALDAGAAPRPHRPVAAVDEADLLARELALLDEARSALKQDPALTLEVLVRHARAFPRGALRVEADVVKLEALLALGRRKEADALAARLTARDGEGLIRERVKRLLEAPPPTP